MRHWCICSRRRKHNVELCLCCKTSITITTIIKQESCSLCRSQVERSIMVSYNNVRLCQAQIQTTCAVAEAWLRFKRNRCLNRFVISTRWYIRTRVRLQTLIIRQQVLLKTPLKMTASKDSRYPNIILIIISNSLLPYRRTIMLPLCQLVKQGLLGLQLWVVIIF